MEHPSEPEYTLLECECGEQIVLLGPRDEWCSRRAVLKCRKCERKLTLDDCPDEDLLAVS